MGLGIKQSIEVPEEDLQIYDASSTRVLQKNNYNNDKTISVNLGYDNPQIFHTSVTAADYIKYYKYIFLACSGSS